MTEQKPPTPEEEKKILEAKREYYRNYYRKNRKKLREYQQQWRNKNPEKVAQSNQNFWLQQAQQHAK